MTMHEVGITTEKTIANPIAVEQLRQEEWQGVTHRVSLGSELVKTNSESLNLALATDEFDADTLDENVDNDQHVDENGESSISESDEENIHPPFDAYPNVPVGTGGEGNESNMAYSVVGLCDFSTSSCFDWRLY
jgi:hypothetical protein